MTRTCRWVLGTSLLAVSLAACSGPDAAPASSTRPDASTRSADAPSPAALPVVVFRNRGEDLRGVFSVKVSNPTDEDLFITSATLRTSAYRIAGPVELDVRLAPGLRVDLSVPVIGPVCDDAAPVTASVDLRVSGGGGPARDVTTDVVTDDLVSWNQRECRVEAVRSVVTATFLPAWTGADLDGAPVVTGTLRLTALPQAGDVVVVDVGKTTLFSPVAVPVPVTVATGQPVDLSVSVGAARCDPHAVAEDKYGFVFPVRFAVDGGEAVPVPVTVPTQDRQPFFDLIERTCR